MERLGNWIGNFLNIAIDDDAWDWIKFILGNALVFGALLAVGIGLGVRANATPIPGEAIAERLALVLVYPLVVYSMLKAYGEGSFLRGFFTTGICFAGVTVAALIVFSWAAPDTFLQVKAALQPCSGRGC